MRSAARCRGYPQWVIGNITQFWRLTRELDVGGLRESFERLVTLRVLGSDMAPAHARGRFFGFWRLIGEIGGLVSPALFGFAAEHMGFSVSFGLLANTFPRSRQFSPRVRRLCS